MKERLFKVTPEAIVEAILEENELLKLQIEALTSMLITKGLIQEKELNELYNDIVSDTDLNVGIEEVLAKAQNLHKSEKHMVGIN